MDRTGPAIDQIWCYEPIQSASFSRASRHLQRTTWNTIDIISAGAYGHLQIGRMVTKVNKIRNLCVRVGAAFLVPLLAIVAIAPAAEAASVTYANNLPTDEGVWRSSSVATIVGGTAGVVGTKLGTVKIQTYYSFPGFMIFASATGGPPGLIYLSHAPATNSLSRCQWYVNGGGIPLPLTCTYET